MTDLIARALLALCARLFPASGSRRQVVTAPTTAAPPQPRHRPLPTHKSRYSVEAAMPFVDNLNPVRPYVTAPRRAQLPTPEQRAQAYRRWALDMATRGIDVGPTSIHGVHVGSGSRTHRVRTAV